MHKDRFIVVFLRPAPLIIFSLSSRHYFSRLKSNRNDGGLGRIFRSIPIMPTSPDQHPFRYDVDWVLGGRRLTNVERQDLVYTTADTEGLTEDTAAMRARRAAVVDFVPPFFLAAAAGFFFFAGAFFFAVLAEGLSSSFSPIVVLALLARMATVSSVRPLASAVVYTKSCRSRHW